MLERARNHFRNAFRILAVEDDPNWGMMISKMLASPLWDLVIARSPGEITSGSKWSAVIADIDLRDPRGKTGVDVLQGFKEFPWKITLSGLRSLEAGHAATRLGGARAVLDKSNPSALLRLPAITARFASLGFMLGGRCQAHTEILCMLLDEPPATAVEWHGRAGIGRRRLEQICGEHLACAPKEAIEIHQALALLQVESAPDPVASEAARGDLSRLGDGVLRAAMAKYPR